MPQSKTSVYHIHTWWHGRQRGRGVHSSQSCCGKCKRAPAVASSSVWRLKASAVGEKRPVFVNPSLTDMAFNLLGLEHSRLGQDHPAHPLPR
eukprot:9435343-Pyramimonas_sp.AAC.1